MEETSRFSASPHTAFTLLHDFSDIAEDKSGKQEMQKLCMT
jgi:hypothetical protein